VPDDLAALVARGEGLHLEFKSRLIEGEALARVLSAFANTDGGTLLIGVADDGTPVGLDVDVATLEARVTEATRVLVEPPLTCPVQLASLTGLTIARIDVPASTAAPHRLYFAPPGRDVYVRVGASVRLASAQVVRRLGSPRGPLPIDARRWEAVERTFAARPFTLAEYMHLVNTSKRTARSELHRLVTSGYLQRHTAGSREEYILA